ncbi:hypothetical protein BU26DRAFT_565200 [Trematosphaeria pertusa]|uniref:Uncharacterized protein n=1 Tax=Trematosphaeria pertusa TaxID=390896 RepID=A0A6A6IJ11_9PLEO|nr:uncharacterized protein BU26DRAFT_565200 [Trematosphaeria pertusa]KAF2249560.1 hypothetical protein BU26DRAFT_565200 [Trematosphaeria pertusa]
MSDTPPPQRLFPPTSPLSASTVAQTPELLRLLAQFRARVESFRMDMEGPPPAAPQKPLPPRENKAPEELKPIVTLVPALEETKYRDEEDKSKKSLAYIRAQRGVLRYLDTCAADSLNAAKARALTESIDPVNKYPSAREALRLCYYMRSQGFDTIAVFHHKRTLMRLFVVLDRSAGTLYWEQNYKTGRIKEFRNARRSTRRHAVDFSDLVDSDLLASLRGGVGAAGHAEAPAQPPPGERQDQLNVGR